MGGADTLKGGRGNDSLNGGDDNDVLADFAIRLDGLISLVSADFTL